LKLDYRKEVIITPINSNKNPIAMKIEASLNILYVSSLVGVLRFLKA
jgi:hypothetical protein